MVSLRPLSDANREEVLALRVAPAQERFVSTVADSLREAAEHPAAHAIAWAVYEDDEPVGFVMVADDVDSPEYLPQFLWKLLIDERHQRRGLGTATLDLVVAYFRGRPEAAVLHVTAEEGEGSPIPFYERYGFERTGERFAGEVLLRLPLR